MCITLHIPRRPLSLFCGHGLGYATGASARAGCHLLWQQPHGGGWLPRSDTGGHHPCMGWPVLSQHGLPCKARPSLPKGARIRVSQHSVRLLDACACMGGVKGARRTRHPDAPRLVHMKGPVRATCACPPCVTCVRAATRDLLCCLPGAARAGQTR